ncbi:hypothetical protein CLU79DRAFT_488604 [Phycomyces nitens]|nr:hypothetical protein CLU79DRAFT_488604 [Phycomyces nitens]
MNYSLPKLIALSEKAPSIDTITSNSKDALSFVASSANVAYNNLQNNEQINNAATAIRNAATSKTFHDNVKEAFDRVPNGVKIGAAGVVVGGIATPLVVMAPPLLLGFWPGGIIAGSPAAAWMATYAGAVPAGSLFAGMQSLGALGMSAPIVSTATTAGAATGAAVGAMISKVIGHKKQKQD